MNIGRPIAVIAALLVAVQVARMAAVTALAPTKPQIAQQIWSAHPSAEVSAAMISIAEVAKMHRPVPQSALAAVNDAARREPLSVEPFLVSGIRAQLAGDMGKATQLFEAAQWRDPRSLPAAYFLADQYLRAGKADQGLREVAAVARLSPNGLTLVGPYLATYAADRRNWSQIASLLRAHPELESPVLDVLASKQDTASAVLALADPRTDRLKADWFAVLLNTLTAAGQYGQAKSIWSRAAGVPAAELIHDSTFKDGTAPPPFNWDLTSSGVGLAERQSGGRLHVIFYGQEDGILATQLLSLPAGSYRLAMQMMGDPGRATNLNWSLWCDRAAAAIASVTLPTVASDGWSFKVPANCPAQWLKLSGSSGDISQQIDVTIARLSLQRRAPGG